MPFERISSYHPDVMREANFAAANSRQMQQSQSDYSVAAQKELMGPTPHARKAPT